MAKAKLINLSGWGNFPKATCYLQRPEKISTLEKEILDTANFIPRGAGKSYGDASLNNLGVISSLRLNKFIAFDSENGLITCQAGVLLSEIIEVAVIKGWFLNVLPGTKYVSVGGAVAGNVHGKNHYKAGDFAEHITNIKLRLPSGDVINCSINENSEVFSATIGGMGMTGFIEEVTIKLKKIDSISLKTKIRKTSSIEEMLTLFEANAEREDYMVGWLDHFASGNNFGKGYFETASHLALDKGVAPGNFTPEHSKIKVPGIFPSFILNKHTMNFYNKLKFFGISEKEKEKTTEFENFFHPLDGIGSWNNLYGKNGFLQYQFIIPHSSDAASQIKEVLSRIQKAGFFSFLAVVKYHKNSNGLLTFPVHGYSVALDFSVSKELFRLLDEIDEYVAKIGGRVYLGKDARMKRENFEKMYVNTFPRWKRILKEIDPKKKITSLMSDRLGFKDY